MIEAVEFAGFLAGHAIWSIYDGETLLPIYGYINESNGRVMGRLVHERFEGAVAAGQYKLEKNPDNAKAAILIYDGRVTLESGKIDSLIVELRSYGQDKSSVTMALPYTPSSSCTKFAVHRPKVIGLSENLRDEGQAICDKFFEGVDQHRQGSRVWNEHIDESI